MAVIKATDLSKSYTISHEGAERYTALRDVVTNKAKKIFSLPKKLSTETTTEEFWALKDINFEVKEGDRLGIIGRNGAGKSTLLKLLSRITEPTKGRIELHGRVASLLEVGTGFHPELTGRENVFLNGAILGMSRVEIKRKFDEIVDFAEVERFLDTPVKRYSSGMYVRLAFAVAAHLEPEILVVDEVLAVGDAQFQKKCLGKMEDVSKNEGRTVLFVSHNLSAVSTMCNRGILLRKGELIYDGTATDAISEYMASKSGGTNYEYYDDIYEAGVYKLNAIRARNAGGSIDDPLIDREPILIETELEMLTPDAGRYHLTYHLSNEMGETMFSFGTGQIFRQGINKATCEVPAGFFQSGHYTLHFLMVRDKKHGGPIRRDTFTFSVVDGGKEMGDYMGREPGYIRPQFEWKNEIVMAGHAANK